MTAGGKLRSLGDDRRTVHSVSDLSGGDVGSDDNSGCGDENGSGDGCQRAERLVAVRYGVESVELFN